MTEPVGVDAAMERLEAAVRAWQASPPDSALGLLCSDIDQLLAEILRLRAAAWHE